MRDYAEPLCKQGCLQTRSPAHYLSAIQPTDNRRHAGSADCQSAVSPVANRRRTDNNLQRLCQWLRLCKNNKQHLHCNLSVQAVKTDSETTHDGLWKRKPESLGPKRPTFMISPGTHAGAKTTPESPGICRLLSRLGTFAANC
jgi:hypothetical protein